MESHAPASSIAPRRPRRLLRAGAVAVVVGLAVVVALRTWLVPAVIRSAVHARYDGRATFRSWSWNGRTAVLTDVSLHEGNDARSPVWATARRVEADISLGRLLRGSVTPARVGIRGPNLILRLDEAGRPLTRIPWRPARTGGRMPTVAADGGRVEIHRLGRESPMVVTGISAHAEAAGDAIRLRAETDDPEWGPWTAEGLVGEPASEGTITLTGPPHRIDPARARRLAFVPLEVWNHVLPTGPVGVVVRIRLPRAADAGIDIATTVTLRGTTLELPSLGFTASQTTGELLIHSGIVRLRDLRGRAFGGDVFTSGTMDFRSVPDRFDLRLSLAGADVSKTPRRWGLGDLDLTGRLSGSADLRIRLSPRAVDLTGTTGTALVSNGSIRGIPVKSLRLRLRAEGDTLRYETDAQGADSAWRVGAMLVTLALQAPKPSGPAEAGKDSGGPAIRLPDSITSDLELEDVDLSQLLARGKAFGIPMRLPLAGRLSLKVRATIPLGTIGDMRAYVVHGSATLKSASIAGVDLGRLDAKLDVEKGVLTLKDFRGRFVDRPAGSFRSPPPEEPAVPTDGELPVGVFRGALRAELAPRGKLTASLEGRGLPIGELLAPRFPRPTPVGGTISLNVRAESLVARLRNLDAWTVQGAVRGERLVYRDAPPARLSADATLAQGRLTLSKLDASLNGKPLVGELTLGVDPPHDLRARLKVRGWSMADVLAYVPGAPRPAPVKGEVTAELAASGTLSPRNLRAEGRTRIADFRIRGASLGDLDARIHTDDAFIRVDGITAKPFGGSLSAEARVPVRGDAPAEATIRFADVDLAKFARVLPGAEASLGGKASGHARFTAPMTRVADAPAVRGDVFLEAPDLTVRGLPAKNLKAALALHGLRVAYDIYAEGLGGKFKLKGEIPLLEAPKAEAAGELQAVGFGLAGLWKPLGVAGAAARLDGLAAMDAHVITPRRVWNPKASGVLEVRELRWGPEMPLGDIKAAAVVTSGDWRLESLSGTVLDGLIGGRAWSPRPPPGTTRVIGFGLQLRHASLAKTVAFVPWLAANVTGVCALRVSGRIGQGLRIEAEADVERGTLFGLPLTRLHAPAELTYSSGGAGLFHVRRAEGSLAGGRIAGEMNQHFGAERRFRTALQLTQLDLETLTRAASTVGGSATGHVSGRVVLEGADPADLARLRGRIELDLDDASIFELPVLRELDRFLGSAQGGVFEDGDLEAVIADRRIVVESFTLAGRVAQLHATGTVGFDGRLDLVALINTSRIIPETGEALARLIPGLNGRREQAVAGVSSFLSGRLLKLKITGTIKNPSVNADPTVIITGNAAAFFGGVLGLPIGPRE